MQRRNEKEGLPQNLNQNKQTLLPEVSKTGMHPNCANISHSSNNAASTAPESLCLNKAVPEHKKRISSPNEMNENITAMSFYESMQGSNGKEGLPQNINQNNHTLTEVLPEVSNIIMHPNCTNISQSSNATSSATKAEEMKKLAFERYMMSSSSNTMVSCDAMQGNNRKEGLLQNINQNNQTLTEFPSTIRSCRL
eukprot:5566409-Ditylum_brightwellii.AAC.1